jgi:hypothetical protein
MHRANATGCCRPAASCNAAMLLALSYPCQTS